MSHNACGGLVRGLVLAVVFNLAGCASAQLARLAHGYLPPPERTHALAAHSKNPHPPSSSGKECPSNGSIPSCTGSIPGKDDGLRGGATGARVPY